jgi:CRISPR/Cas system-associated protein endoribonuclease Cas2
METARVATAAFKKFRAWTATASLAVNTVRRMLLLTLRNRQFPKMTILLGVLKMKNALKGSVADMVVSV